MNKRQAVIDEYNKTYTEHPSYLEIATRLNCSKSLVAKYIREHIASLRADSDSKEGFIY